jgi:hypothetical protein
MVQYFAAVMTVAASFAASTKVEWQSDYGKALAATRSDQRPLLVVLDDPADPKARLDAQLLDETKLLKPFRVCRVDVSTDYGRKVAEAFHATQFPHTAIIDKTGAVVIYKKPGQISENEWSDALAKYKSGDRSAPVEQTVYYRGDSSGSILSDSAGLSNPAYCPSCQRKAMGLSF